MSTIIARISLLILLVSRKGTTQSGVDKAQQCLCILALGYPVKVSLSECHIQYYKAGVSFVHKIFIAGTMSAGF